MTNSQLDSLAKDLASETRLFVAECVASALHPLLVRIADLERQLGAVDARVHGLAATHMVYAGVWSGLPHSKGDLVQHGGGLWLAIAPTAAAERPGAGQTGWRLVCKGKG